MRLLYWTESFWPRIGGSEVAAMVLLNSLAEIRDALGHAAPVRAYV
jgi:hypothetical protein